MKLENNSLKYGINSANNANSAFSNAYNQEMENQRNVQTQTTQRQKTLLDALDRASNEKAMIRDRLFGVDPKTGLSNFNPKDATQVQQLDDEIARSSRDAAYPYLRSEAMFRDSIPRKQVLDINGNLVETMSDQGFSYITAPAAKHPDVVGDANRSGLSLDNYLKQTLPYGSLPTWRK